MMMAVRLHHRSSDRCDIRRSISRPMNALGAAGVSVICLLAPGNAWADIENYRVVAMFEHLAELDRPGHEFRAMVGRHLHSAGSNQTLH